MSKSKLIKNATIVNEGSVYVADVLIVDNWIERVESTITTPIGAEVIEAAGLHLLPGVIDDQVHFREPGLMHKGDLTTNRVQR
jgi:dihydroorotase